MLSILVVVGAAARSRARRGVGADRSRCATRSPTRISGAVESIADECDHRVGRDEPGEGDASSPPSTARSHGGSRPGGVRHDVTGALGLSRPARAFAVGVRRLGDRSVCIYATAAGERVGLGCSFANPWSMVPAVGRAGRIAGSGGPVIGYSVSVEAATGLDPEAVAGEVDAILADARSWIAEGTRRFARVGPARAQLEIIVATPPTVDRLCAPLATAGYLSCRQGRRVIMNADRWAGAVPFWTAGIAEYRAYLVNHEVGSLPRPRSPLLPGAGRAGAGHAAADQGSAGMSPERLAVPGSFLTGCLSARSSVVVASRRRPSGPR